MQTMKTYNYYYSFYKYFYSISSSVDNSPRMKLIVVLLASLALANAKFSYENYKVYKVVPRSKEQLEYLKDLQKNELYDFWSPVFEVGSDVRIMVSPVQDVQFREISKSAGFNATVAISNVQE